MDLAERAVMAEGWRWMPGMLATWRDEDSEWFGYRWRVVSVGGDGLPDRVLEAMGRHELHAWGLVGQPGAAGMLVPVLDDHATLGCLLARVRAFHLDRSIVADYHGAWLDEDEGVIHHDVWVVWTPRGNMIAPTEGGALVLALEAAP